MNKYIYTYYCMCAIKITRIIVRLQNINDTEKH